MNYARKNIKTSTKNYTKLINPVFSLPDMRHVSRLLDRSMKELGIPKQIISMPGTGRNLHTFRKTRITHWIVKQKLSLQTLEYLTRDNYRTLKKYYADMEHEDYRKYVI